ncbi:UNVERIFIED_CONTAM: Carbon catabolite repressor protein 44 [Sesamum angustifolium]|uniref:Carbon catabolite repressor protein 44 n=1 Tax=Sesamum angustifolium TaxID=2727405 RepID=A0AAW2MHH2_9LAMI
MLRCSYSVPGLSDEFSPNCPSTLSSWICCASYNHCQVVASAGSLLQQDEYDSRTPVSKIYSSFKFRLVSYNILAQEVDEYDTFYKKNLENLGYASIYIQRSGKKRDGCGIFYKQNSAELVIEEKIDYNDLVDTVEDGETSSTENDGVLVSGNNEEPKAGSELKDSQTDRGDPNDPRVRLKRDCVGIMAAFSLKNPSSCHVIIANTHLYWDPEWADVKIAQAKYLLSRLAGFKDLVSDKFDCSPPIILSGDFNSVPGDQVHQYLVSGTNLMGPETADDLPMPLSSVYAFTRGEPEFTNCTPGFTGTLDYIFFSPSGDIKPVSYLELPEAESSDVIGGLPNYFHPSDHLPIGAEFAVEA